MAASPESRLASVEFIAVGDQVSVETSALFSTCMLKSTNLDEDILAHAILADVMLFRDDPSWQAQILFQATSRQGSAFLHTKIIRRLEYCS